MSNEDNTSLTHVVTLRDIYEQGQTTHTAVIRLESAMVETIKDVEKVQQVQEATNKRVGSLELDRAKVYGMAALLGFLSSGATIGIGSIIVSK